MPVNCFKIDFGGENFQGFAVTQFATPTNMASQCDLVENETSMQDIEWVTELHRGPGVWGYQPVFLSAPTIWEWSVSMPHAWRLA